MSGAEPRIFGPLLTPEAARAVNRQALDRREAFQKKHPEISIRAKREGVTIAYFLTEPGEDEDEWGNLTALMDYLEAKYTETTSKPGTPDD